MIKRIPKKSQKSYGRFFLATEAPGDEPSGARVKRKAVRPSNEDDDMDTDFNVFNDDDVEELNVSTEPESQEPEDTEIPEQDAPSDEDSDTNFNALNDSDETPTEDTQTDDAGETTDGNIENTQATDEEAPEEGTEEPTQDTDAETDTPEDSAEQEDDGTEDGGSDTTGYEDQDTDFNDDTGEDDAGTDDDTATDAPADTTSDGGTEQKGPGVEYDSTRKYNLFKEFMSLFNALENYIDKLENSVKDDPTANQVNKIAVENLREIKDLTYDFMTIKFEVSTYVQSLVFYQLLIVGVQSVFNLINTAKKTKQNKK